MLLKILSGKWRPFFSAQCVNKGSAWKRWNVCGSYILCWNHRRHDKCVLLLFCITEVGRIKIKFTFIIVISVCLSMLLSIDNMEWVIDSILFITLTSIEHQYISIHLPLDIFKHFVQANIKRNTNALNQRPFIREPNGDCWISLTKDQSFSKCLHVLTSSCILYVPRCVMWRMYPCS